MTTRCRVCHRELKNPAHVAAGIGPECAAKGNGFGIAASQAKSTDEAERAAYAAKVERVRSELCAWLDRVERNLRMIGGNSFADRDLIAEGQRVRAIIVRALVRVERIRVQTQRAAKRAA